MTLDGSVHQLASEFSLSGISGVSTHEFELPTNHHPPNGRVKASDTLPERSPSLKDLAWFDSSGEQKSSRFYSGSAHERSYTEFRLYTFVSKLKLDNWLINSPWTIQFGDEMFSNVHIRALVSNIKSEIRVVADSSCAAEAKIPKTGNLHIDVQLQKLANLKNGWLDGEGLAPSLDGIAWLAVMFGQNYSDIGVPPYLYPTEEGHVQVEWTIARRELSLDIDLETRIGYWHELDLETGLADDRSVDISSPFEWEWLGKRLEAGA